MPLATKSQDIQQATDKDKIMTRMTTNLTENVKKRTHLKLTLTQLFSFKRRPKGLTN